MNIRWIGAILVIVGCGSAGFSMAAAHRREEVSILQLQRIVKFMQWELKYRLTPLPELCRQAAGEGKGQMRYVMQYLAMELERQTHPDPGACMAAALGRSTEIPRRTRRLLRQLGQCLGRFDLDGQLDGLEGIYAACRTERKELNRDREERLRSYRTLGVCTGAALAILLL